jgi:hypothetical protein
MPVTPAPRRLKQEDHEFKTSLDYIAKSYLKQTSDNNKNTQKNNSLLTALNK